MGGKTEAREDVLCLSHLSFVKWRKETFCNNEWLEAGDELNNSTFNVKVKTLRSEEERFPGIMKTQRSCFFYCKSNYLFSFYNDVDVRLLFIQEKWLQEVFILQVKLILKEQITFSTWMLQFNLSGILWVIHSCLTAASPSPTLSRAHCCCSPQSMIDTPRAEEWGGGCQCDQDQVLPWWHNTPSHLIIVNINISLLLRHFSAVSSPFIGILFKKRIFLLPPPHNLFTESGLSWEQWTVVQSAEHLSHPLDGFESVKSSL